MKAWSLFPRLLQALALLGLLLAPLAGSPAIGGMAAAHETIMAQAMDAEDMPCNQHGKPAPALPDCAKTCSLMALCLATWLKEAPEAFVDAPLRQETAALFIPRDDAERHGLGQSPPPRPPRT